MGRFSESAQPELFGTEPKKLHRSDAPATSIAAAHAVDTAELERLVLATIKLYGPRGCISDEVRERHSQLPYSSVTARYAALEEKGLIVRGPDTRKGKSGRAQQVMRAKDGVR